MPNGKCLPLPCLPTGHAIQWPEVSKVGACVVETALHLPTPDIELAVGPAIETGSVRLTLVRKGPTHFPMPASKHPSYQVADPAPRRNVL